eukprot:TRINITY_DN2179_c0_g1_i10.p1 TRINITY_DN2179_c0_g1~~TRINITY_DN2179_c0_g1_i10.p1  ORF type:complete len:145 (-),score=16.38 TRINITY_DN2179_c0_g1_i10:124-558(-)
MVFHPGKRQRVKFWDSQWPKDKPDFLMFTLYKENKDTTNALVLISHFLKINPKVFNTSGTKDKRAVTTQKVTAYRVPARKLLEINKKLQGIQTGIICLRRILEGEHSFSTFMWVSTQHTHFQISELVVGSFYYHKTELGTFNCT